MNSVKTTPELGNLAHAHQRMTELNAETLMKLMELTNSLLRERNELKSRVTKLEKSINKKTKRVKRTLKREHRTVKVPGGKLVMNFVLGKNISKSRRILQETQDFLKIKGERTDGLYIDVKRRDEEIIIWSHSVSGLDFMYDKIKTSIIMAVCIYDLDLPGYAVQRVKVEETTSSSEDSDEYYTLPPGLLDGE